MPQPRPPPNQAGPKQSTTPPRLHPGKLTLMYKRSKSLDSLRLFLATEVAAYRGNKDYVSTHERADAQTCSCPSPASSAGGRIPSWDGHPLVTF
eukprot:1147918-Pelagomonas_calceolata.AAC.3